MLHKASGSIFKLNGRTYFCPVCASLSDSRWFWRLWPNLQFERFRGIQFACVRLVPKDNCELFWVCSNNLKRMIWILFIALRTVAKVPFVTRRLPASRLVDKLYDLTTFCLSDGS